MAGPISDEEFGRRLSAGRGYRRETVAAFARRIKVERHELTEWEKGEFGSDKRYRTAARKRSEALKRVRDATGLPTAFFFVDLNDLSAMEAAWKRIKDPEARKDLELAAEMEEAALEAELADEFRQSRPNGSHSAISDPSSETP